MVQHRVIAARPGEGARPFSRGVSVDIGDRTLVFVSGTASVDETGATLHAGDAEAQTRRVFTLIAMRLAEVGGGLSDIVKVLIFVRDIADYPAVNAVRLELFPVDPPASSAVEARMIRDDFLIEIEAVAVVDHAARDGVAQLGV